MKHYHCTVCGDEFGSDRELRACPSQWRHDWLAAHRRVTTLAKSKAEAAQRGVRWPTRASVVLPAWVTEAEEG